MCDAFSVDGGVYSCGSNAHGQLGLQDVRAWIASFTGCTHVRTFICKYCFQSLQLVDTNLTNKSIFCYASQTTVVLDIHATVL